MTREEIIKSLRICAGGNGGSRCGCAAEAGLDCSEKLLRTAADMLEQDGKELAAVDGLNNHILTMIDNLDGIIKGGINCGRDQEAD